LQQTATAARHEAENPFDGYIRNRLPVGDGAGMTDTDRPLLSVLIPVYNEVATVQRLLDRVLDVPLDTEIIVVDDGSTDDSGSALARYVGAGSIRLLSHPVNRGKGAAIRTGLSAARGSIVLIQDADLEYDPAEYPALLAPLLDDPHCMVVYGSRFRGDAQHMSSWHRFGNRLVTRVFNLLYGTSLTDMETCFKAIRREALDGIVLTSDRWGFDPEITARLVRAGHDVTEVPVAYYGRDLADGKKLRWSDGFSVLVAILRFRVTT
jgi:glycosyltransferase involved in cell wall biosynthesis